MAVALNAGLPAVSNPPKAPLARNRPGTAKSQKEAIGSHGERVRGVGCGVVVGAALLTRRGSKLQMRAVPAVKERAEVQSQRRADQEAFARGYESASSEECFTLHSEDLPKGLRGTYYRNGPAKLKVGDDQIKHPFDGDGMVAAVTFDGQGNVHFRNRFVRTAGFVEELEAQKMLYRGQFSPKSGGWLANAFDMRVKNLANTNVMHWAGRLFALWEGGKPMELDPLSVATLGQGSFDGALKSADNFTAHPRFDARTGRQVGFQYKPDIPNAVTNVSFWEFEPSDFSTARRVDAQIPDFGFYHDFLVTENYYILSKAPVSISPQGALEGMLGFRSMGESIRFDASKPTQLALVPRDGSEPRFIDLDTHFCFHFGNGYEEDGKLIIDMAFAASLELGDASSGDRPVWESFDWEKMPPNSLCRYEVDLSTGAWQKEVLLNRHVDFPTINPFCSSKLHRYIYCTRAALDDKAGPLQGLTKVDVQDTTKQDMWLPEPHEFLGEAVFCPDAEAQAEDDGYLVGILLNGRDLSCEIVVFDAHSIQKGPVCRVPLPSFIPHALHGCFVPNLVPTYEQIQEAWNKRPTSL